MGIDITLTKLHRGIYSLVLSGDGTETALLKIKASKKKAGMIKRKIETTLENIQGMAEDVQLFTREPDPNDLSCSEDLKAENILQVYHTYKRGERPEAKAENIETDIGRIRKFIQSCNTEYIDRIEPADFDRYKSERLKKIKPTTLKRELNPVHAFFKWCYKRQLIQRDVSLMAGKVKVTHKREIGFLTNREADVLLLFAGRKVTGINQHGVITYRRRTPIHEMAAIALYAGLRLSEILHLKKMDIDFETNCIAVKNREGFSTKTLADRRIPMFTELRETLNEYCIGKHFDGKDYMFTTSTGRLIHRSSARHSLKAVARAACVPEKKANWNILRHTFATNLVSNGVSIFKVSKWLGHDSIRTTERYYAKFRQRMDDPDIEKVNTKIIYNTKAEGHVTAMETINDPAYMEDIINGS